jgi:predicted O-methyltransferase YrrM
MTMSSDRWKSSVRTTIRTGRTILNKLFLSRVIRQVQRTGPVDDLGEVVNLAMGGYAKAIVPIQNREEILGLLRILKKARPRRLLEIGTAGGGSLFMFTRVAAADALIVSIDLPGGPFGGGYPEWKIPLYQAFPLPGQRLELIRDDSHAPAVLNRVTALLGEELLDFVFIDGDHTYDGVKQDYAMYGPLVKPGGCIAFHDIEYGPGVGRLWNELTIGRRFEEIRDTRKPIYGIGVLYV